MKTIREVRDERAGLVLLKKPVRRVAGVRVLREASTGRVVATLPQGSPLVLPRVWAVAQGSAAALPRAEEGTDAARPPARSREPQAELAFYRKYTEAMLRRYAGLSMESGRVPSLLGRELFRGHVTSYKVRSFDDVVIFCHDVEKRLGMLQPMEQQLIKRIALQQYTQGEAAGLLGLSLRGCIVHYGAALDRLTRLFLADGLLEPLKSCQEGGV